MTNTDAPAVEMEDVTCVRHWSEEFRKQAYQSLVKQLLENPADGCAWMCGGGHFIIARFEAEGEYRFIEILDTTIARRGMIPAPESPTQQRFSNLAVFIKTKSDES